MYFTVQMCNATGGRVCHFKGTVSVYRMVTQVVMQRTIVVVLRYKEHLSPWTSAFDVSSYETWMADTKIINSKLWKASTIVTRLAFNNL